MKNRKLLSLLLAIALLVTQFSMMSTVSAATTTLTGRSDFLKGVCVHPAQSYPAYKNTSKNVADAKALGSNFIRIDSRGASYDLGVVKAAQEEGIQVMIIGSCESWFRDGDNIISASQVDIEDIASTYATYAAKMSGKLAYIQIGNEMPSYFKKSGNNGKYTYNYNDVSAAAVAIYAANKAIKENSTGIKTVVNYAWYHYGFIQAVREVNIDSRTGRVAASGTSSSYIVHADFDVVGIDWYATDEAAADAYKELISTTRSKFSKDIIICEANVKATSGSENGTITYNDNPSWLSDFITYCYGVNYVKGFCVYELYDEPSYSYKTGSYVFNRESHFGLLDKNGNPKAAYTVVKTLYGGTGVVSDRATPSPLSVSGKLDVYSGEIGYGVYGTEAKDDDWIPMWTAYQYSFVHLQNEVNFNNYDFIEFDYYVDNLTNLKARATSLKVGLMHYSGATTRWAEFLPYLTKNGWNHVAVPIANFSGDAEISRRGQQVRFKVTMPASSTAANDIVSIANICATEEPEGEWDEVPVMTAAETDRVFAEGKKFSGTFGTSAVSGGWLPGTNNYSQINFSRSNLRTYDYIEFDFYIQDLTAFKSRVSVLNLAVMHYSGGTQEDANIIDLITANGWSHIKVPMSSFTPSGREWVAENAGNLKFTITMPESSTAANTHYTIANIRTTSGEWLFVPAMQSSEGMHTFATGSKYSGKLGSSAISDSWLPGQSYSQIDFAGETQRINFRNYDYLEFDYYTENVTDLKARVSKLDVTVMHYSGGASYTVNVIDMVTKDGWNHISIPITSYTVSGREWVIQAAGNLRFKTTMTASSTGADVHYVVANICLTRGEWLTAPAMQTSEQMRTFASGVKFSGTFGSSAIDGAGLPGQSYPQIDFTRTNLRVYDYIECDLYVQNLANFTSSVSALNVIIMHYSGGTDQKVNIVSMVTKSGWNHIQIPMTSFATSGREWVVENAGNLKFTITISASSAAASDHYTFANITATKKAINAVPSINNAYTTMDSIPGTQHTMNLAAGENPITNNKHFFRLSKTLDTSNADHIEMDIYVTADTDVSPKFWVSSNREAGDPRHYYNIPLLTEGWNHVVIDAKNTGYTWTGSGKSFDFNTCTFLYPFIENPFYSSEHPTGGTVRIANLSVTCAIVAPTDYMAESVEFTDHGLEFITFDENDMYMLEFEEEKDISDARMIELDLFVASAEGIDTVTVEVMDTDGNYADFGFTGLVNGWNHFAVRLADLNQNEDNADDVDLSSVAYFTVYGAAGAEAVLSNVCAADYVDGDANRDGIVDIKDVVRAKRLAAGATTAGNKLAVSGADYEINATDLTSLIHDVINSLFS